MCDLKHVHKLYVYDYAQFMCCNIRFLDVLLKYFICKTLSLFLVFIFILYMCLYSLSVGQVYAVWDEARRGH